MRSTRALRRLEKNENGDWVVDHAQLHSIAEFPHNEEHDQLPPKQVQHCLNQVMVNQQSNGSAKNKPILDLPSFFSLAAWGFGMGYSSLQIATTLAYWFSGILMLLWRMIGWLSAIMFIRTAIFSSSSQSVFEGLVRRMFYRFTGQTPAENDTLFNDLFIGSSLESCYQLRTAFYYRREPEELMVDYMLPIPLKSPVLWMGSLLMSVALFYTFKTTTSVARQLNELAIVVFSY
jgi:hypothetical protein